VDRKREMHRRVDVNPSQEITKKILKMFLFPSWKCVVMLSHLSPSYLPGLCCLDSETVLHYFGQNTQMEESVWLDSVQRGEAGHFSESSHILCILIFIPISSAI
jgi:hypothetical protein